MLKCTKMYKNVQYFHQLNAMTNQADVKKQAVMKDDAPHQLRLGQIKHTAKTTANG